jgi:hypothetical protein
MAYDIPILLRVKRLTQGNYPKAGTNERDQLEDAENKRWDESIASVYIFRLQNPGPGAPFKVYKIGHSVNVDARLANVSSSLQADQAIVTNVASYKMAMAETAERYLHSKLKTVGCWIDPANLPENMSARFANFQQVSGKKEFFILSDDQLVQVQKILGILRVKSNNYVLTKGD